MMQIITQRIASKAIATIKLAGRVELAEYSGDDHLLKDEVKRLSKEGYTACMLDMKDLRTVAGCRAVLGVIEGLLEAESQMSFKLMEFPLRAKLQHKRWQPLFERCEIIRDQQHRIAVVIAHGATAPAQ